MIGLLVKRLRVIRNIGYNNARLPDLGARSQSKSSDRSLTGSSIMF